MAENADRLSRRLKFIYSLGEFAPSVAVGTIVPFYFLFFLTDVAGIRPGVAGTLLLVARLWDAINDPLVGNLSDRTQSRWGRRRPFMLFGAVPMGLLFMLIWFVPPFVESGKALYYLAVYILFDTAITFVQGPYAALTPELTADPDERTSLITWRMAVSIITGLAAAVGMDYLFSAMPDLRSGFAVMGIIVGLISIFPAIWISLAIRERPEYRLRSGFTLREGLRLVFQNKPFLRSVITETFAWTAIALVEGVFAYYLVYWAGLPQEDSPLIMAIILASAALFLPLVNYLSGRFEKKWAFVIATGIWAMVHIALFFIPQYTLAPIYIAAVLAGFGVSAAHVLPGAMTADTLEITELQSGQRREGIFTGISAFTHKLGVSASVFTLGWVLDLTGYVANAASQSASALMGIRVLVSWVPLGLLLVAIVMAIGFPVTRTYHAQIRAAIRERRHSAG